MKTSMTRTQRAAVGQGVKEGAAQAAPSGTRQSARRATIRKQATAWAFLTPIVIYLVLFYAYPLYTNLDLSFRDYTLRSFISGEAEWAGFENYRQVLTDNTFGTALWNTFVFTGASLLFQYAIGLALAVFFYRKFPLSSTLRALFLVPWLLPLLVSASTWAWMLNSESGIVNAALSWIGLDPIYWLTSPDWSLTAVLITNIWIGIPFNLVLLYAGLQAIPTELYEASSIDGAGRWRTFWSITFPLLRPVSAITVLLGLVYTLKVFDIIWVMTRGGPGDSSATLAIWSYRLGFGGGSPQLSPAAAVANILILIAFAFGLFYVRAQRKALNQ
ncbi:sugar ABC transporter permease [Demequina sp.]|uniref:carbohydrate ABC transporter permease n=1 Tax=Demequina sp. TaxID=2050685 RepID=UPI0025C3EAB2|nr:sugar ABC transporter permease [Demequina sp.]